MFEAWKWVISEASHVAEAEVEVSLWNSPAPQFAKNLHVAKRLLKDPRWLLSYKSAFPDFVQCVGFGLLSASYHRIRMGNPLYCASTAVSLRIVHSVTKSGSYVFSLMGSRFSTRAGSLQALSRWEMKSFAAI